MSATSDPVGFFTKQTRSYARYIRLFGYPRGIRAFFLRWPGLRSGLRVLDAGCGTGVVTLALREAMLRRRMPPGRLHGFDLTPAMLEHFREELRNRGIDGVDLAQADVLRLEELPAHWKGYDLIVSASMLEYLSPERLPEALSSLRALLAKDGRFVLFISRRTWLMRLLVGQRWRSNLYFTLANDLNIKPTPVSPTPHARETRHGARSGPVTMRMLGGYFQFDRANAQLLVKLLPPVVQIRREEKGAARLRQIIELICEETESQRPGRDLILERLVEVLLVEALRFCPTSTARPEQGLVAGLSDPALARPLRDISSISASPCRRLRSFPARRAAATRRPDGPRNSCPNPSDDGSSRSPAP